MCLLCLFNFIKVELCRVSGTFPQDRMCEAASDSYSDSSHEDDDHGSQQITCYVHIKQATGLPLSLSHYVFCQYTFWNYPDPIVVPDISENAQKHTTTVRFDHKREFTVPLTEEFIEHCAEGALSIEVWGNRSTGFSKYKPGWEVEQQQLATARSLLDRWSELTRKIELWVEIQELNELGEYAPVEVTLRNDILTGGVFQLRQGQQRRIKVRVKPVQNSGTLPIICQQIVKMEIGCVVLRGRLQKGLDSYQDGDLKTLREKWTEALHKRRQYLNQQLEKLSEKGDKTEEKTEREKSLLEQIVNLTEESNAVYFPPEGSGIPGAPAKWIAPAGMEHHIPVLFLDLNGKYNILYLFATKKIIISHNKFYWTRGIFRLSVK